MTIHKVVNRTQGKTYAITTTVEAAIKSKKEAVQLRPYDRIKIETWEDDNNGIFQFLYALPD